MIMVRVFFMTIITSISEKACVGVLDLRLMKSLVVTIITMIDILLFNNNDEIIAFIIIDLSS